MDGINTKSGHGHCKSMHLLGRQTHFEKHSSVIISTVSIICFHKAIKKNRFSEILQNAVAKYIIKKNVVLLFMKRFILTCRKLSYICAVYMQSWTSVRFLHKTFFYHNHVAYFIMMPRQIHFIWHAKNDHKKSHKDKVRRPFPSHASAL